MAVRITAENLEAEVLNSTVPVLLDFYSDSCIPCKRLSPVLAELEEEYGGRFKLCKVNVNANPLLSEQYGVLSAPTLIFCSNGEERQRRSGFAEKEALREMINQILEDSK